MANNFSSNFTREVMKRVLPAFESMRVMSRNVNTQLFQGKFNPNTGDNIDIKRPTDYVAARTSGGDISAAKRDIITGKATATVQDYITVAIDYDEADEALKMGSDITRFWDDAAQRIVTELETDFAAYMLKNCGLLSGTVGTAVSTWKHVADCGSTLAANGIPAGPWYFAMNPYTQSTLAEQQRTLGAVDSAVSKALDSATLRTAYAGFDRVMAATTLATYTTGAGADRAGTLSANPDVTYATAKDTMTQSLAVTGMDAALPIVAGDVVQISGRNRLNLATRDAVIDASGSKVLWTGVVTADVTLSAGAGTIVATGPAIYEATGGYNTTDTAAVSGDVITVLGSASTTYQPNLFWHRDAFAIASVPIKKLHSTDTVGTTKDGLQLRVSKYADGDANQQTVRIDLRPAYGVMNPFFAGHGYG